MPFMFEVGETYETQCGIKVTVLGRVVELEGHETLVCSDGKYRYDRSTHSKDAGRVTGTDHDYSDPFNFRRLDVDNKRILQLMLDLEANLSNAKQLEDMAVIHELIKKRRGTVAPPCHGHDDCSTMALSMCPWRIDCGG